MSEKTNPSGDRHIPALDGVRGIAIAMVVVFHIVQGMPSVSQETPRSLILSARIGQTGVDLFFVLSGYLITGILLNHREEQGNLIRFWGRRILRIFPLYYTALIAVLMFPVLRTIPASEASGDGWLWTFLANVPPTFRDPETSLPHFWSLAVEEQFYLFWPLLVMVVSPRHTSRICLFLFVLSPIVRYGFLGLGWSTFYALPCRMDALVAGGWLASSVHQGLFNVRHLVRLRWVVAFTIIGSAVLFGLTSGRGLNSVQVAKHSLSSVIYLWLTAEAVMAQASHRISRLLCLPGLQTLGKYSYGLYVVHPMVIAVGNRLIPDHSAGPGAAVFVFFTTLISAWIIAILSWNLIEAPCLRLKRHFRYPAES
jgi:peptidoglycan/LPS O-acetylase OafA/YrhL